MSPCRAFCSFSPPDQPISPLSAFSSKAPLAPGPRATGLVRFLSPRRLRPFETELDIGVGAGDLRRIQAPASTEHRRLSIGTIRAKLGAIEQREPVLEQRWTLIRPPAKRARLARFEIRWERAHSAATPVLGLRLSATPLSSRSRPNDGGLSPEPSEGLNVVTDVELDVTTPSRSRQLKGQRDQPPHTGSIAISHKTRRSASTARGTTRAPPPRSF